MPTLLTRFVIPPSARMDNPYKAHQTMWAMLGQRPVYRVDPLEDGCWEVHALHSSPVNNSEMVRHRIRYQTKGYSLGGVSKGEILRFKSRVNFAKMGADRKRRRILGDPSALGGFDGDVVGDRLSRSLSGAATVVSSDLECRNWVSFQKGDSGGSPISFESLDIFGKIRVEDPRKLEETILKGIGKAKTFGFGLLMLRRS